MASVSAPTSSATTCTVELTALEPVHTHQSKAGQSLRMSTSGDGSDGSRSIAQADRASQENESRSLPTSHNAVEVVQRWNHPKHNTPRIAAAFWSFVVMGANDAAYGALIPSLEKYYNLNYTVVSLIFLSPFIGYTSSAILNNWVHVKFGQRGLALIVGCTHLLAFLAVSFHPPYAVLVVAYSIVGFGNGLADAGFNAWIGNMDRSNELLGFLHGLYGLGAVISPLVATALVTQAKVGWWNFYYFMTGCAALELIALTWSFWPETGQSYRESVARGGDDGPSHTLKHALFKAPWARVTWLCAFFLLGYVGTEVSLGGWIVVFMIQVRKGEAFASGMTATGFWLGLAIGRLILGFVTPRIGEKLSIMIYLPCAMAMQLLFWLVPQFYVSAVAVALQGFFLGPLFPAAVVVTTRLLPRHLHVTAIGFAAAFGGSGAAILPFAVGAIAQARGVQVLQPIILAFLVAIFLLWLGLPRINKRKE